MNRPLGRQGNQGTGWSGNRMTRRADGRPGQPRTRRHTGVASHISRAGSAAGGAELLAAREGKPGGKDAGSVRGESTETIQPTCGAGARPASSCPTAQHPHSTPTPRISNQHSTSAPSRHTSKQEVGGKGDRGKEMMNSGGEKRNGERRWKRAGTQKRLRANRAWGKRAELQAAANNTEKRVRRRKGLKP